MNSVNGPLAPTEQAVRPRALTLIAVIVALPGNAFAQAEDLAEGDPLFSGVATLLVAAVALIVIAWQRRQVRRETLRAEHFAERSGLLEAALDSTPWPHFGWTASGTPLIDPAFATALGLPEIDSMDDLLSAVGTDDRAALKGALSRLRAKGTAFDLRLHRGDGRPARLIGRRGSGQSAANGRSEQADLIWCVDAEP
ncbi:MAG: hypothetical protein AAFX92_01025 [Pseudomonadota bacterium]